MVRVIDQVVRQTEERQEMEEAFQQLSEAHQEISFRERRAREASDKLGDSRTQLNQAVLRVVGVLQAIQRDR